MTLSQDRVYSIVSYVGRIKIFKQVKTNTEFGESVNPAVGILGAWVLAIGGALLFEGLGSLSQDYAETNYGLSSFTIFFGFTSFLFIGIGLWLIVQSGRIETKQNPS